MRQTIMCAVLLAALAGSASAVGPVTTESLLREMAALEPLASPAPYVTFQFSSYDRSSKAPYLPGWYANSDGFGGEPAPNVMQELDAPDKDGVGRHLIAEMDGPGAIVRTWTPMPHPMNGRLVMWLDGKKKPVYDGKAADFVRARQSCWETGFDPKMPGITQEDANYFPIPFAKHLRIEWIGKVKDLHFYHIGVRRYDRGVRVKTFNPDELPALQAVFEETSRHLAAPDFWRSTHPAGTAEPFSCETAPGEAKELFQQTGAGALVEFGIRAEACDTAKVLRQTVLLAWFDGAPAPQIEAPLGDFFGSWPGITPYDSLPMTVRPDGTMVCRFVMPYAKSAVLKLRNFSDQPVKVNGWRVVGSGPASDWHFCAKWRVNHDMEAGGGDEVRDLPYLVALGRGAVVGAAAHVLNTTPVITIGGSWWGEGDEKIWLDQKAFPAYVGTGSEDYFNYSWSRPDLFSYAYCAQPMCSGPGCAGYTTNIRWHILDPIPFREHIGFFMELFHHSKTGGLSYARTVYYYAPPQTRDDAVRIGPSDVRAGMTLPGGWKPVAAGAPGPVVFFEAEDVLDPGAKNVEVVGGDIWSGGRVVVWHPLAENDRLSFNIDVPESGKYRIVTTSMLTPASGRFMLSIDGQPPLPGEFDLYTPHLTLSRFMQFSAVNLERGPHRVTVVGHDRCHDSKGTQIGIDLIWLWPEK